MTIFVGTASWTDPTLIASRRFYPAGCTSAEARLRFYATQFPLVEVDSSYYAMPSASNSVLWVERTPAHFTFNVKAFRLFTGHQTDRAKLPKDIQAALPVSDKKNLYYKDTPGELLRELWRRYIEAIEPLRRAGKLGAVHFQFAPWVVNNDDGRAHVEHCADVMEGFTLAAEFRHKSWFSEKARESTLAMERERAFVNVVVDEPNTTANSIPAVWEVTNTSLALIRLHGRNHETWNIKGATSASSRFNYDYNDDELGELAGPISEIAKRVERTHVVFNNNWEDQGQRNAKTLMQILGGSAIRP
ncbi:DUF72 domain-containing protein [Paraburkholderia aromaticivorans]|uniref:DUF72 domain-containing protein n=2 Tax=Paraburkholderia aromaticivorans TaxID=2026199 RepID=A0A248VZ61_9BURK|nr:DUF72 domain-containing protein [Paraburkholderia aromaticivorans]ASW04336.1 hypothetical protein CJU94_40040 [Paraburkholderia aromaticivorans]